MTPKKWSLLNPLEDSNRERKVPTIICLYVERMKTLVKTCGGYTTNQKITDFTIANMVFEHQKQEVHPRI